MHQQHLSCCILTSKNIIRAFPLTFWLLSTFFTAIFDFFNTLSTHTVTCLVVDIVEKSNCYLSVIILPSQNISGTLFLVCWSPYILRLPFSCILTWKCINDSYSVAVYTRNRRCTPFFFSFFLFFCLNLLKT